MDVGSTEFETTFDFVDRVPPTEQKAPETHAPTAAAAAAAAGRPSTPHTRSQSTSDALVFLMLLAATCTAAWFHPIADCDETFNYWEPTHYLLYGSGFQTWEYSPEFSLRSYFYVFPHLITGRTVIGTIPKDFKLAAFYGIRFMLAFVSAFCSWTLYRSIRIRFGKFVGVFFATFTAFSSGMLHASVSYLPSSASMYLLQLSLAYWISRRFGWAIFWGVGSVIFGWPFVVLLSAPLGLCALIQFGFFRSIFVAILSVAVWLIPCIAVDSHYYNKFVLAPLELMRYNVQSSDAEHGSHLYGVEDWHYYLLNLTVNFNVVFLFALACFPVSFLTLCVRRLRSTAAHTMLFTTPFLMWLAFMSLQAHKEERFMYPIYHFIPLAASLAIGLLTDSIAASSEETAATVSKSEDRVGNAGMPPSAAAVPRKRGIFARLMLVLIHIVLIAFLVLSISHSVALVNNYSVPFQTWHDMYNEILPADTSTHADVNVCIGKEWYRFPSSFFLPYPRDILGPDGNVVTQTFHLRFVRSGFHGQLPQPFASENGTSVLRAGFNDLNQEDMTRYVPEESCHYLVERDMPDQVEPHYIADSENWDVIYNRPFFSRERSPPIWRWLYVPSFLTSYVTAGEPMYDSYYVAQRRPANAAEQVL